MALIGSIISVLVCFLYQPFRFAFGRFYIDTYQSDKKSTVLISSLAFSYLIWGISFVIILILFDNFLFGWAVNDFSFIEPYLSIGYIYAFLSYGFLILSDKLIIDNRSIAFAITNIAQFIFTVILTIILVVPFSFKLWGVYGAMLSEGILTFIFSIYYTRKYYRRNGIKKKRIISYGAYALPLIPHALSFSLLDVGDRILMQYYLPIQFVGVYQVGYQISMGIYLLYKGFARAFTPQIMKIIKEHDDLGEYQSYVSTYLQIILPKLMLIGVLVNLIYLTWTKEIFLILIHNPFYNQGFNVITIILAAMFFIYLQGLFLPILHYKKKSKEISATTILSVLINIILNIILIPMFGIIGAAYATLIASVIRLLLIIYYINKQGIIVLLNKYLAPVILLVIFNIVFYVYITPSDLIFNFISLIWKIPLSILLIFFSYYFWSKLPFKIIGILR